VNEVFLMITRIAARGGLENKKMSDFFLSENQKFRNSFYRFLFFTLNVFRKKMSKRPEFYSGLFPGLRLRSRFSERTMASS